MENDKYEMWTRGCKVMRAAGRRGGGEGGNESSFGAESNSVFLLEEENEKLGKT